MASIRPVGVLGNSLGHAALWVSSVFAAAALTSFSNARCESLGSTVWTMSVIGQSVSPAMGSPQTSAATRRFVLRPCCDSPTEALPVPMR
jgi:hypothetical protein